MENNQIVYVSVSEAAKILEVSLRTVYNWIEDGRIVAHYPGGKAGEARIPKAQLENFYRPKEPVEKKE